MLPVTHACTRTHTRPVADPPPPAAAHPSPFTPSGWGIVAVVMGSQYYFGYRIILHKKGNSPNIQARSAIFQELLPAMKLVKYYAWEQFFEKEVATVSDPAWCCEGAVAMHGPPWGRSLPCGAPKASTIN
jgi:hypothetical protein